jgi:hypothetical protein
MIPQFLKRAFTAAVIWLLRRYRQISLDLLKIKGAIYYVRGVQAARSVSIISLLVMGLIATIGAGLALLPIGLAVLIRGLGGSWIAAGLTVLVLGALYVIAPLCIFRHFMTERAWMTMFKTDELIARVTRKPPVE